MALSSLEEFVPVLEEAAEPIIMPVPAGAVKVLPRWNDEDEVLRWRLKYRVHKDRAEDITGIQGCLDDGELWVELELRPFTRELPLTGLLHGQRHYFKVALETASGWSDWSRVVGCVPPSPELPGKCAAVFAMVSGKHTAVIRWTRPIDFAAAVSCGHIKRYKLMVTWPPSKDAEDSSTEILIDDDVDTYEVDDLVCLRDYRFQVAAENVTGWGDWSDPSPVLNMPPPVPNPPPQPTLRRATHHSAVIQWQHPPAGDAPIESFRFRYTTQEDFSKESVEVHDVPANLSQYVINGLHAGLTYIFQVRALNRYGMGIWSDSSIPIKTLDGHEPSKITDFSIPHVYRSFITLQWKPAAENGFEVTQHLLRFAHSPDMADAIELEPVVTRKGNYDTTELRHLQKKMYCFQVAAFNKMGMSEWSVPMTVNLAEPAQIEDTQGR
mmetsp:Transcript_28054/g.51216  ORF Transcript_28054/g.51216 Transcript_28054/m.51216 type:complete len:438 (-) Transcript_28054:101-1414(-)